MALHTAMIGSFQDFSQARQQRLAGVITEIPNVLWYAVLVGALVNVILFVMLKMRFVQHLLLGIITSFFLGVILFVIVSLDDPMRGEQGLEPRPFLLLWERQMIWDEGPAWTVGPAAEAAETPDG
jgi:ABC-type branched-subunit amino acid transport system permease subunit